MSHLVDADKSALLAIFEQTYEKISEKGLNHGFSQEGVPAVAKRISDTAAWADGASRELGLIGAGGLITPFAKVNGKGYVEPVGDMTQQTMETVLKKIGNRVAQTTPCQGEGTMYHYSANRPPSKVF
jgi:hypothetical protein